MLWRLGFVSQGRHVLGDGLDRAVQKPFVLGTVKWDQYGVEMKKKGNIETVTKKKSSRNFALMCSILTLCLCFYGSIK